MWINYQKLDHEVSGINIMHVCSVLASTHVNVEVRAVKRTAMIEDNNIAVL